MTAGARLSAIVPVYNEREALAGAIAKLDETLAPLGLPWEIVLVESGSTDGTDALCDELAEKHAHIRVVHEGERRGFGSAIRNGICAAEGDWVWIVPVDLPFPLDLIREALTYDCDAIVSYRENDPRTGLRRIQSSIFNTLSRWLLGLRVRSVNSAFKLYRRRIVAVLPLRQNGWLVDAEILFYLTRKGARIHEISAPLIDRQLGTSKVGALDGFRVFVELLQLRLTTDKLPS